jgi:radical SAM superfamily enzyme YgiQ (UPF0313 family)
LTNKPAGYWIQRKSQVRVCNVSDPASFDQQEVHPLGSQAKVLLASIFGPYAQDDEYGSRSANPMELYHNQVTRIQGPFSLRMFHRSCGLKMIQANIKASCTILDYPDSARFIRELRDKRYDIIGISAIPANLKKVAAMCSLIREHQPEAMIVVGGHIANMQNLGEIIDADIVVRGEGIRWFRKFLGEAVDEPIQHPLILSSINPRCMGLKLNASSRDTAAVLIPSVGCPKACNFCSTSAMFGGRGKFVNFYETGDELFDIMCQMEDKMGVTSFFVLDENFLFHRKRAFRLQDLMAQHGKVWALHVFSSADILVTYTMEQLVGMGISWVWIGLEGKDSQYRKVEDIDTQTLVRELQANGIRVLGSTIIGLEHHTPENIDDLINWAVSHNTDFHQFMLYFAPHGTPLYAELAEKGALRNASEIEEADVHGQYQFNYLHPHIKEGRETEFLLRAFRQDYETNGPSVMRILRTIINGWLKYRHHPDFRFRRRFEIQVEKMPTLYAGALWATRRWFKNHPILNRKMTALLQDIHREFGFKSRFSAPVVGWFILILLRKEDKRLTGEYKYEPPTFYETSAEAVMPERPPAPHPNT